MHIPARNSARMSKHAKYRKNNHSTNNLSQKAHNLEKKIPLSLVENLGDPPREFWGSCIILSAVFRSQISTYAQQR